MKWTHLCNQHLDQETDHLLSTPEAPPAFALSQALLIPKVTDILISFFIWYVYILLNDSNIFISNTTHYIC